MGDGLHNIISAGDLDRIAFNYLEPHFATRNFDEGVVNAFNQIHDVLIRHYGTVALALAENSEDIAPQPTMQTENTTSNAMGNGMNIIFFFIIVYFVVIFSRSSGRGRGGLGRSRRRGGAFSWIMPSLILNNRRARTTRNVSRPVSKHKGNSTAFGGGSPSTPKYKGNSTAFGGGSYGGGMKKGGTRTGGGGRSSGGGVGRRKR